jgi:hypothetical protein
MRKILFIAFLAILSTAPAYADGGRGGGHRGGHGGGWGWGGDWIFPALIGGAVIYSLTQPQPVYVQPPPVYVPNVAPPSVQYWYYCADSNAYYPYVSSCPRGWQAVPAIPPNTLSGAPYAVPAR